MINRAVHQGTHGEQGRTSGKQDVMNTFICQETGHDKHGHISGNRTW